MALGDVGAYDILVSCDDTLNCVQANSFDVLFESDTKRI